MNSVAPQQQRRVRLANGYGPACSTRGARGEDFRGTCRSCAIFLILLQLQVLFFARSKDFPGDQEGLSGVKDTIISICNLMDVYLMVGIQCLDKIYLKGTGWTSNGNSLL